MPRLWVLIAAAVVIAVILAVVLIEVKPPAPTHPLVPRTTTSSG